MGYSVADLELDRLGLESQKKALGIKNAELESKMRDYDNRLVSLRAREAIVDVQFNIIAMEKSTISHMKEHFSALSCEIKAKRETLGL